MSYADRCYWNSRTYGKAVRVKRGAIELTYLVLAVLIPVIVPIPGVALVRRVCPDGLVYRYGGVPQ